MTNPNAKIRLLGAGFDLRVPLGADPAKPTAGSALWDEVPRPLKVGLTDYTGDNLVRLDVPVFFDGHPNDHSVMPDVNSVLALCFGNNGAPPPSFIATGPFPFSGLRYVMEAPDWGDSIRTAAGVLTRQELTLKIIQFVDPDSLDLQKKVAAGGGAGGGANSTSTVVPNGPVRSILT